MAPHLENCIERKTKENKTDKIKRKDKKEKVLQSEVHKFQKRRCVKTDESKSWDNGKDLTSVW